MPATPLFARGVPQRGGRGRHCPARIRSVTASTWAMKPVDRRRVATSARLLTDESRADFYFPFSGPEPSTHLFAERFGDRGRRPAGRHASIRELISAGGPLRDAYPGAHAEELPRQPPCRRCNGSRDRAAASAPSASTAVCHRSGGATESSARGCPRCQPWDSCGGAAAGGATSGCRPRCDSRTLV